MKKSFRMFRSIALAFGLVLALSPLALGQVSTNNSSTRARTVASGEKMKIKGVVVKRDADTFTVRDLTGNDTIVRLTDRTSVKTNSGFLRGGTNYGATMPTGKSLPVRCRMCMLPTPFTATATSSAAAA